MASCSRLYKQYIDLLKDGMSLGLRNLYLTSRADL